MTERLTLTTPGKLVLLGEYAVLAPGEPALVAAVWPGLTTTWEPAKTTTVSAPDLGVGPVAIAECEQALPFVFHAWQVLQEVYGDVVPAGTLTISGEMSLNGQKLGLGGSASACVAAIRTWLAAMNEPAPPEEIFRLAAVAHFRRQRNGSGIDVAAASFGGVGCYRSPGPDWLASLKGRTILTAPFPYPLWEALKEPETLILSVGFTGQSAPTVPAVDKVLAWANTHPEDWRMFLEASRHAVTTAIGGLHAGLGSQIHGGARMARRILQGLAESTGLAIETNSLATMADVAESLGGSGKVSGAGGGDCGIAFTAPSQVADLLARWQKLNIQPVDVRIAARSEALSPV